MEALGTVISEPFLEISGIVQPFTHRIAMLGAVSRIPCVPCSRQIVMRTRAVTDAFGTCGLGSQNRVVSHSSLNVWPSLLQTGLIIAMVITDRRVIQSG